ncbi:hypothetical protein LY13_001181 [Prauserella aidingensis]|nr:hypothetical protein [Prauserella aidingensis]
MGTSTRYPGPRGGPWIRPRGSLTRSITPLRQAGSTTQSAARPPRQDVDTAIRTAVRKWQREGKPEEVAEAFVDALRSELRADPTAFDLVEVSARAGRRLVLQRHFVIS